MKKALGLALSALMLFLAGSAWLALYPAVPADLGGVRSLDAGARRVRIPVGEDDHLDGWLVPGSNRAVIVLCPGYARDHRRVWRYAHFLEPDGYTLLALDFRSSRTERRRPTTLGAYERQDLDATLAWIAAQPRWKRARVGLFGESLGGSTALAAAAGDSAVDAVVADCPFATGEMAIRDGFACRLGLPAWPLTDLALLLGRAVTRHDLGALDTRRSLAELGARPVLLIQTSLGDRFAQDQVRSLENAAGPGVEGWTVDDSRHTEVWLRHRREYESRVRAFFARHLLGSRIVTLERVPAGAAVAR
ncbi:MAG: alpha/beta fold hydrolase [Candidatus Eisenbacteria bacterium]|nr:alpha/beta fold hydrolase [Candidatus Eisenbacteria bacterium]